MGANLESADATLRGYYTSKYSGEEIDALLGHASRVGNTNLLINGYFPDPINQRGKKEYTGSGYTIDMWTMTGTASSLTLEDDGICFFPSVLSNGVRQYIRDPSALAGRTITMSILVGAENGTLVRCGCNDGALHYSNFVSSGIAEVTVSINENVEELFVFFQCNKVAKSPPIKAANLELGPIQTLAHKDADGNWVLNDPPDYDLQYVLCSLYSPITGEWVGIQHSNPNLLDNWYFVDPINQREQTEYTVPGYAIDRWKIWGGLSVSLDSDGITLSAADNEKGLYQYFELSRLDSGSVYTISVLTSDNDLLSATGVLSNGIFSSGEFGKIQLTFDEPVNYFAFVILMNANTSKKFKAAKLELGPVQTLAHQDADGNWVLNDPPPNKALELAKCQRYFVRLSLAAFGSIGIGQAFMTDRVRMFLPLPQPMRATPSLNAAPGNVFQLVESPLNSGEKAYPASFRTNFVYLFQSGLAIEFIPQDSTKFTIGKTYIIRAGASPAYIDISSDL